MAWKKLGSLRKSKAGSLYIKVDDGVSVNLTAGMALQLQDPRKRAEASVEAGRLTRDEADKIIAKVPDFIKYDVFLVEDK